MTIGSVGLLTIGQSPRIDVTPSLKRIFGEKITIIERGGLDSLTNENMHLIEPSQNDTTYISKLRNGKAVKIGKSKLLPFLQKELNVLEREVNVVIMLCTGDFPTLTTTKPIIYPDKVLSNTVNAIMNTGTLGLIIPLQEQRDSLTEKWQQTNLKLLTAVASPYEKSDVEGAARTLQEQGADLIVLDCMGYNEQHKEMAIKGSGLPVILPRTLTARIAAEYVIK